MKILGKPIQVVGKEYKAWTKVKRLVKLVSTGSVWELPSASVWQSLGNSVGKLGEPESDL